MNTFSAGVSTLIRLSRLLPMGVQTGMVRVGSNLVSWLAKVRPLVINYRNYKVFLSGNEQGGTDIYFFYLLHGVWRHEVYEQSLVEQLLRCAPSPYVIDIGASYGMYSLLAASISNVQHILAIEASPLTCKFLQETINKNKLNQRIELLNVAASDVSGVKFDIVEMPNSEWNKVSVAAHPNEASTISIAIDDLLYKIPNTSSIFIKMDIEGHEPNAFKGMTHLLSIRRNFVLMLEFHVGLLQAQAYVFADALFATPSSRLYLLDATNSAILELRPPDMNELIDRASRARHPFNLYNLLLVDEVLIDLLPALKLAREYS